RESAPPRFLTAARNEPEEPRGPSQVGQEVHHSQVRPRRTSRRCPNKADERLAMSAHTRTNPRTGAGNTAQLGSNYTSLTASPCVSALVRRHESCGRSEYHQEENHEPVIAASLQPVGHRAG